MEPIQRIDLVRKLEPYYAKRAKQNQGTRTDLNFVEIFPQSKDKKTRDQLGVKAGVSGKTYEKGTKIIY